jgi:aryl-phospho-beta-D-glucosidase BglC (GH1 family)
MQRRRFIRDTGLLATATMAGLYGQAGPAAAANPIPRWRGFNLLDFFMPDPARRYQFTTSDHLAWMRDWGFDFIRLPIAYPYYLDIDRSKPIKPEDTLRFDNRRMDEIQQLAELAQRHGMHVSLNLHRAPGYCINAGFQEPFNLWKDDDAREAFYTHWKAWARRFRSHSPKHISFDLLNEPSMREDMNDQHAPLTDVPGPLYRELAAKSLEAIRSENPAHLVVADGNFVGNKVIGEIRDLPIAQSCRGYFPHAISHYRAPWANKEPDKLPEPKWPGQVGSEYLSRQKLEAYYQPWIALAKSGTGVHCGECGCWNKTPHAVFLSWFGDVLDILTTNSIGYALWNFIGDFGLIDSGRNDVAYEDWYGHKLDRKLLELLKKY